MPLCRGTDGTRRISRGQDFRVEVGSQYWRCLGTSATVRTRASALLRDPASGTKSRRNFVRWRAAAGSSGHTPYHYCHDGGGQPDSLPYFLGAPMVFMPQDVSDNNAQDNDNSRPCVDAVSPHACVDALQHGTKVPRCTALHHRTASHPLVQVAKRTPSLPCIASCHGNPGWSSAGWDVADLEAGAAAVAGCEHRTPQPFVLVTSRNLSQQCTSAACNGPRCLSHVPETSHIRKGLRLQPNLKCIL